jgi:hypothetical protein
MNQAYWSERNVPQRFDQPHPTALLLNQILPLVLQMYALIQRIEILSSSSDSRRRLDL